MSERPVTRKNPRKRKIVNVPKEEIKKRKQKDIRKDIRKDTRKNASKIKEKCLSFYNNTIMTFDNISEERQYSRYTQLYTRLRESEKCRIQFLQNKCLVQSSDKKETYIVELYNGQYTCNCGNRYKEYNRKSCKHIIAVCNYHVKNCITDYMTKPTRDIIQLDKIMDSLHIDSKKDNMQNITKSLEEL